MAYGSFWNTMEQIIINGLMGAMDYETIAINLPVLGRTIVNPKHHNLGDAMTIYPSLQP